MSRTWSATLQAAEKVAGYPTSFLSLRCLLSDEFSVVALGLRKLVGTKHPIIDTAKSFVYDDKDIHVQMRGLLVLLMSKAMSYVREPQSITSPSHILPSQRSLAEITELIHTGMLIHRGILNLDEILSRTTEFTNGEDETNRSSLEFGNRLAVLSGDFFLSSACSNLAKLNNTQVVGRISQSIADLTAADFMDRRALSNFPAWKRYVYLSSSNLFCESCQCAALLANLSVRYQSYARQFGSNIALAYQLKLKIEDRRQGNNKDDVALMEDRKETNLYSSPPLSQPPSSLAKGNCVQNDDWNKSEAKLIHLCDYYRKEARRNLFYFPQSDARTALDNLLESLLLLNEEEPQSDRSLTTTEVPNSRSS